MSTPEKIRVMPRHEEYSELETEVELLKARLHAAEQEVTRLQDKVDNLRLWQAYVLGAAAAVGAMVGAGFAVWSHT